MKATLAYINRLISACRSRLAGCDCCVVNDSRNAVARCMVLTGGKGMKNSFRKIRAVDSFATTTTCTHFDDSSQQEFIHRKISEVIGFSSGYPRGVDFRRSAPRTHTRQLFSSIYNFLIASAQWFNQFLPKTPKFNCSQEHILRNLSLFAVSFFKQIQRKSNLGDSGLVSFEKSFCKKAIFHTFPVHTKNTGSITVKFSFIHTISRHKKETIS
jgi:hypothetical protein